MTCPSCGVPNPEEARFCNQCGATLGGACTACGHANPPESKFCNECGAALHADAVAGAPSSRAPAASPPPPAPAGPASPAGLAYVAPAGPQPGTPGEPAAAPGTTGVFAGERKQVTVMFADVTGFTSMSEKLDPEDVHGIMNRCFEVLVREVHRYEGTINQFTGDGIMALFGAPIARTDSPQRAVLAALSIQHALEDLADDFKAERGITFRMRIGLNTGLVVVGTVGSAGRYDYTAVGDTTNLAARMEQMAEPGTILITENTYRVVLRDFACESLGQRTVKGRTEAVEVYRVSGLTGGHDHADLHAHHALTPFVGRDEELRILRKHVERALAGDARVIGIMAEIGVGKSRLVHELLDGIDRDRVLVAEGHCLSYGGGVAYMPFLDLMRDLQPCLDDPDCAGGVLHDLFPVGEATGGAEGAGLNSLLLTGRRPDEGSGDAAETKQKIFARLLEGLFAASDQAPLLLVIEDLQWIDPTSEELLGDLIRGMAGRRIGLICTFTAGYRFPWADRSYYRHITIDRLSRDSTTAIVRSVLGGTRVPPDLLALVEEGAEGNPYYIEASLRMLQDDGFLEQTPEGVRIARPLSEANIPDSIQDIVMASIDRLAEPVKRTLQVAAVIGRVFEVPLLTAVLQAEGLTPELDALVAAEMITSRGPDTFVFRQGVTRDVAYAGLLRSHRRDLHQRVGMAIEWVYGDRLREFYARLGHQFAKGNDPERAIHYLQRGAARSRAVGVVHEGADQLGQALKLVATLPATPDRQRLRVDLLEEMADMRFLGGAMEESARLSSEALTIAESLDYRERLGRLYVSLGGLAGMGIGTREDSLDLLQKGLHLCEEAGDTAMLARGYMHLGNALRSTGRWPEAQHCYEQMIRLGASAPESMGDVIGPSMLAFVACETGHTAQALAHAREALAASERRGSDWAVAAASSFSSDVFFEAGEFEEADRLARQGLELGERLNVAFVIGNAGFTLGRLAFAQGRFPEALRTFKQHLARAGSILGYSALVRLSETALALGRVAQASGYANDALEREASAKEAGRAERVMGHALLHCNPPELTQAGELIDRALERYRTLGMPLELALTLGVAGQLAYLTGDEAGAQRLFDEARGLCTDAGALWRVQELDRLMAGAKAAAASVL